MALRGLFGFAKKSPFVTLQTHGDHVVEATSHLPKLMRAFVAGDRDEIEWLCNKVGEAEHAADETKNALRLALPKGIFLPVDRRDFLHYLSAQDSIADVCQDMAVLMRFRPFEAPVSTGEKLVDLADRVSEVMDVFASIVKHFGDLFEASFRGPEAKEILLKIEKTGMAESIADQAERKAARSIFAPDYPGSPVDVFLLSKIIDRTGGVADVAERSANRLRLMLSL
jgi:predicted phosphate transport protein (TIGR00153 family)